MFSVSIEDAEDQAARDILADYLAAELRQVISLFSLFWWNFKTKIVFVL